MSVWRACIAYDDAHVIDESGKAPCGTQGLVFPIKKATLLATSCRGCRRALGDLRQDDAQKCIAKRGVAHAVALYLQFEVKPTGSPWTREALGPRCIDLPHHAWWAGADLMVATMTCLECLAIGGTS